jgi:beta-fructofuranosidase
MNKLLIFIVFVLTMGYYNLSLFAQTGNLVPQKIDAAIKESAFNMNKDPFRPAFHMTPPTGCMGDPNGGLYMDGWYHIFYGLNPFAYHPGEWYWEHARSKDLIHWERMKTGLTPAYELGLHAIGSGSTIITSDRKKLAFYSDVLNDEMMFWQAQFTDDDLTGWKHEGKNPVITLKHQGLPSFDKFFRDPFVFEEDGRTFLICCADLFDEDYVPVPIFEATNKDLTEWDYKGILFTVPKYKYRNLEVPQLRRLDGKWLFTASTDAPIDRTNYFIGEFNIKKFRFTVESEGTLDYSGHYYAQESISDDKGNMYMLAWMPGWDRDWLPNYMNEPQKNSNHLWNGCFSLPRKLNIVNGQLIQKPIEALKLLRGEHFQLEPKELTVSNPITKYSVIEEFNGNQLEISVEFDLCHASFCGINLLSNSKGSGGLFITWSGNVLNVDGVLVPIKEWGPGQTLKLQIFVDKKFVEVFANDGKCCVSRQVREENVKGNSIAFTSLGGTAKLISFDAWKLGTINQ